MAITIPIISEFADKGVAAAEAAFGRFKTEIGKAEGAMGKMKAGFGVASEFVKTNAAEMAAVAGAAIAGFAIKARAYNAFLQGQFRDSSVTYEQAELRPWLVEAWAGYTFAFQNGYRISYLIRGHSSEIRQGAGDRNLIWGGLIIARNI